MMPFIDDPDFTLYVGDVRDVLAGLPDESVHCVVTSPPYWGLRDYGTGEWDGGDPDCDHTMPSRVNAAKATATSTLVGSTDTQGHLQEPSYRDVCRKCGARRVDRQIGLESTPDLYVENMVAVFREVRRVLRRDGTCWLNLGDSYAGAPVGSFNGGGFKDRSAATGGRDMSGVETSGRMDKLKASGLKPKDLVGVPWRVAFALQADGWYLRADVVWSKPNPMPESVSDRPTKAHEYLFLMTRSPRYFFDQDAVREDAAWDHWGKQTHGKYEKSGSEGVNGAWIGHGSRKEMAEKYPRRNIRSVWEIATEPYPDAHFATFPQALVEPCVKAGCPEGGTVLDPFMGSGTTALVARRLGRRSVGVELNETYAGLAARRLAQLSLLA